MRSILLIAACAIIVGAAGETRLGKPFVQHNLTPIAKILENPESFVGKTVQVKGKIVEVCEMMGCWMNLVDVEKKPLRIKVNDGEIVFPKSAIGKMAVAEGKLTKLELSRENAIARAKHEAEEQGREFDPESVKAGLTVYQIAGSGALIFD